MALRFYPHPGMLLICDFDTGFIPQEMVKKRPVVILSPQWQNAQVCRVVPLSTREPHHLLDYHHKMSHVSLSCLSNQES